MRKDQWGCAESRPLPPGTYTIKGRFKPKSAGPPARVETTFRIVPTSSLPPPFRKRSGYLAGREGTLLDP
jgi:hypothetical protein